MGAMSPPVLAGDDAAEYQRLYIDYYAAISKAVATLKARGMDSEEFRQADADAGRIWKQLRELQGMSGKD